MKAVIWGIFAVVALAWTGFAALVAQAISWSAEQISSGAVGRLEMATNNIVIPAWANPWLAPADWATILMSVQSVLDNAAASLPLLASMIGWLAPLVWVVWAFGLAVMFAVLIVGLLLLKRYRQRGG